MGTVKNDISAEQGWLDTHGTKGTYQIQVEWASSAWYRIGASSASSETRDAWEEPRMRFNQLIELIRASFDELHGMIIRDTNVKSCVICETHYPELAIGGITDNLLTYCTGASA